MRVFLAAIVGIVTSGVAIWGLEFVGHLLFPIDFKIDPKDIEALRALMFKIPIGALFAVLAAHGLGVAIGMFVSGLIDKSSHSPLYAVGGVMLLMTVLNLLMLPHPIWFMVADISIILIVSLLFILRRKKA